MDKYLIIWEKEESKLKTFFGTKEQAYEVSEYCKQKNSYCHIYEAYDMTEEFYRGIV